MIGAGPRIAPATLPRTDFERDRLLVIDPLTERIGDYALGELPLLVGMGDTLIVNDAATLPASLRAEDDLELRLVSDHGSGSFTALALGAGDWRTATEERGTPRALRVGERLRFGSELSAQVEHVDDEEPRLLRLRFELAGAELFAALYRRAQPIQYSYAGRPLELWDVQNRYAGRPWAFELPSAGRPLTFDVLFAIEKRGARVSHVTHAASLSSTGSGRLDARLPLPERFEISPDAATAVAWSQARGGRVIAVGTSVVRALEARARDEGAVTAGSGEAVLRLDGRHRLQVVDGVMTGLHEPGTSHYELLEAFAPARLLERAVWHAARAGYLQHEFGDSCLILPGALKEPLDARSQSAGLGAGAVGAAGASRSGPWPRP